MHRLEGLVAKICRDMEVGPGWDCGWCRLDGPNGLFLYCRVSIKKRTDWVSTALFPRPTLRGSTVVSTAVSQLQGPGFDSRLGSLSVRSLHILPVSVWVSSGCSGFLPQSERRAS